MKIRTKRHRGKLCFAWLAPGKKGYQHRVVKDPNNIEHERVQLAAELLVGKTATRAARARAKPIAELLVDFLGAHAVGATGTKGIQPDAKHTEQGRRYITRSLSAAKITTIDQLDATKLKRTIGQLRVISHKTFKRDLDGAKAKAYQQSRKLLSTTSRNIHVAWLRSFSKWLVKSKAVTVDPLADLLKWPAREEHPRSRFEPAEVEAILASANEAPGTTEGLTGPERVRLYMLAMATGLRKSELASLTPTSFDGLDGELPVVYCQGSYTKNHDLAAIGLHESLFPMLREWLPTLQKSEPLFPGLAHRKTDRMVRRDSKAAGVPYLTPAGERRDFHSLRHVHVSLLWEIPGITGPQVMEQARHKSMAMTQKYSHAERARKTATARRLVLPALPGGVSTGLSTTGS